MRFSPITISWSESFITKVAYLPCACHFCDKPFVVLHPVSPQPVRHMSCISSRVHCLGSIIWPEREENEAPLFYRGITALINVGRECYKVITHLYSYKSNCLWHLHGLIAIVGVNRMSWHKTKPDMDKEMYLDHRCTVRAACRFQSKVIVPYTAIC